TDRCRHLAAGVGHASPSGARHAAPSTKGVALSYTAVGQVTPPDRGLRMRVPNAEHTSRPWRIQELTEDFRLEDVWALPGVGGPGDFPRLVELIASSDPSQGSSFAARTLFAIRWKLGELFGWDRPDTGVGSRVETLRDRLPAD